MGFLHPFIQGNELFLIDAKMHFRDRRCSYRECVIDGLLFSPSCGCKRSIGLEFFSGGKVCGTMYGGGLLSWGQEGQKGQAQHKKRPIGYQVRSGTLLLRHEGMEKHRQKLCFHLDGCPYQEQKEDKV